MKIALLIPSTSRGRDWSSVKETYLFNFTLKTFALTYNKEHEYRFYIGIDREDKVYDNQEVRSYLERFVGVIKNTSIEFVYMDGIQKGHLTVMWNRLFEKSYNDGYDYFFQCGDDISFETRGWVNACIETLRESNNIGMTGPLNNNCRILTQCFVSRKHMEIFGYFFPEEIINWCCDDWINEVYKSAGHFFPLRHYYCNNIGGLPRYDINNNPTFNIQYTKSLEKLRKSASKIAQRDVAKINEKLKSIV